MNQLKRNELPCELLEQMDAMVGVLKSFAVKTGETPLFEKFLEIRGREVWDEKELKSVLQIFANLALTYFPEAPQSHRLAQEAAIKVIAELTVASTEEGERDPAKRIAYGPMAFGYVKLSETTIERLNQCYADFYLMKHKEPKAIQILEALPFITKTGETMAWFVARIVNVCRKKSLRLSFEKDLALAGMKLVETKRSFSVVYSHISSEDEARVRMDSEIVVNEAYGKKSGGLS